MRVRKNKDGSETFICSMDYQKEVNKAQKELIKKLEDVVLIDEIYKKAKKERDYYHNRIRVLRDFMNVVRDKKGVIPDVKGDEK